MKLRRLFLHWLTPVQRLMQKVHRPEFRVRGPFYMEVLSACRDGDVLLSREDWHLTNYFIPGFWKHAALLHGEHVIEAVGEGVRSVLLAEWVLTKDYVCLLRFQGGEPAGAWAAEQIGKRYDYLFGHGTKEFFCSELVEWALRQCCHIVIRRQYAGTTLPSDLWRAGRCILDSRNA